MKDTCTLSKGPIWGVYLLIGSFMMINGMILLAIGTLMCAKYKEDLKEFYLSTIIDKKDTLLN